MRPPPPPPPPAPLLLLWPLLLQLGGRGAAAPPADSRSQLPAPENPKIHLYNDQQVLSWEAVSLSNGTRPVVYRVQFKYSASDTWSNVHVPNCMRITATECNFTQANRLKGFPMHFNVSLRVRAEQAEHVSAWVTVPWFEHYRNVTIGPPENIWVTPGEGSLIIRFSPPFDVDDPSTASFSYHVRYWEKEGRKQEKGPFKSNSIVLDDLKPLREYCLQVQAQLLWKLSDTKVYSAPGHPSNTTCLKTTIDASTKLQRDVLIAVGTFLVLAMLAGSCLLLVLKYRGLIKYWFHSPPSIPLQIEEYLKDPVQPILEALDKDGSPKDDTWDSVSVVSCPEKE